jgi:hypothetical protein
MEARIQDTDLQINKRIVVLRMRRYIPDYTVEQERSNEC